jgi:CTP:phosphocholine cytidylyltransferase-like protein
MRRNHFTIETDKKLKQSYGIEGGNSLTRNISKNGSKFSNYSSK